RADLRQGSQHTSQRLLRTAGEGKDGTERDVERWHRVALRVECVLRGGCFESIRSEKGFLGVCRAPRDPPLVAAKVSRTPAETSLSARRPSVKNRRSALRGR